jgi:hypothetical protein
MSYCQQSAAAIELTRVKYILYGVLVVLPAAGRQESPPLFREVSPRNSRITWVHESGRSPNHYLPETAGPGVAVFDYNNDGKMDILFVNSGSAAFYNPATRLLHGLYRNNGDGTYTDVTQKTGITADIFGMGEAIGDYDGDGWPDIFITGYGRCILYHNNRNGTFTDVTSASGILPLKWGTTAVWFDYDNDGKLDLFVGQFADYSERRICQLADSYGGSGEEPSNQQAYYCSPKIFSPLPSHLYRNIGGGRFQDVSEQTGIASRAGKAWGVVAADINKDGYTDLFVANDTMENFLWVNRQGKKFEEVGLESGTAFSADGGMRSGMGVDAADFDRDGNEDLIVANIDGETTSLYRNKGSEEFADVNIETRLASVTRMFSGWGLAFFDYDNDGWPDLILANGHPDDTVDERHRGVTYREPLFLLRNVDGRNFENMTELAGPAFKKCYAARGLAVGDLDNDGYQDIVFTENGGSPHLLMNSVVRTNQWLGLELVPKVANPGAIGAVIRWSVDGKVYSRTKIAGGSFLSSRDPREIIGTGKSALDWIEVRWPAPSRSVDRILRPKMNEYMLVGEGKYPMLGK